MIYNITGLLLTIGVVLYAEHMVIDYNQRDQIISHLNENGFSEVMILPSASETCSDNYWFEGVNSHHRVEGYACIAGGQISGYVILS